MRPALTVLIGPAGAGKSTLVAHRADTAEVVLSLDAFRALCSQHGEESDQAVTPEAVRALHAAIPEHLAAGRNVLVDATNAEAAHRRDLLELARPYKALRIALVVLPPLAACLGRNDLRDPSPGRSGFARRVPSGHIAEMHAAITADLPTMPAEGWDVIAVRT